MFTQSTSQVKVSSFWIRVLPDQALLFTVTFGIKKLYMTSCRSLKHCYSVLFLVMPGKTDISERKLWFQSSGTHTVSTKQAAALLAICFSLNIQFEIFISNKSL